MYVLLLASMLFVNVSTYSLMIIQLFATPRLLDESTKKRRGADGQTADVFFLKTFQFFRGKLLGLSRVHTTLCILYTVCILDNSSSSSTILASSTMHSMNTIILCIQLFELVRKSSRTMRNKIQHDVSISTTLVCILLYA